MQTWRSLRKADAIFFLLSELSLTNCKHPLVAHGETLRYSH
jgi:hypothetical protein